VLHYFNIAPVKLLVIVLKALTWQKCNE